MENQEIYDLLTLVMLPMSLLGFGLIVAGTFNNIGRSNAYRGVVIAVAVVLTLLYTGQTLTTTDPVRIFGFPLLGIPCWGIITFLQVLQIRMNNERKKYEHYFRPEDGDRGV